MRRKLESWQTQIETFGLHLARLDVRQNAKIYAEVINEIMTKLGLHSSPGSLDESLAVSLAERIDWSASCPGRP